MLYTSQGSSFNLRYIEKSLRRRNPYGWHGNGQNKVVKEIESARVWANVLAVCRSFAFSHWQHLLWLQASIVYRFHIWTFALQRGNHNSYTPGSVRENGHGRTCSDALIALLILWNIKKLIYSRWWYNKIIEKCANSVVGYPS